MLADILEGRLAHLCDGSGLITGSSLFSVSSSFGILTHGQVGTGAETIYNILVNVLLGRAVIAFQ